MNSTSLFHKKATSPWWLVAFFIFHSAFAEIRPTIKILVGHLREGQAEILKDAFFDEMAEGVARAAALGVHIDAPQMESNAETLKEALQDPNTIGVLWLGHPALDITKNSSTGKSEAANIYIEAADGRYLPPTILSAAHAHLQFVSLVTCNATLVNEKYAKYLRSNIQNYFPPSSTAEFSTNPLMEMAHFFVAPIEVFNTVVADLPRHLRNFIPQASLTGGSLEIHYRDLLSKRFDYEVLVNGKYIGSLYTQRSAPIGRVRNRAQVSWPIPAEAFPVQNIVIRPADAERRRTTAIQNVVDDVLIDQVRLRQSGSEQELLTNPVHLGDDSEAADVAIGLSFESNLDDFATAPLAKEWRWTP
jgi:hypothetical protein